MSQHNKLDNPQTSSEKSQPRASIMLSPRKENPVNTSDNPNLIALSTESANKTMDLNQRLKSFEQSIKSLQNQVDTSHQKFHHSILDLSSKTQTSKEELYKSQHNVQGLENSYKMLNAQASDLSTKTSTISQALEELSQLREQSEQNLDNKLIEKNNQVSLELQQITKNVEQLDTLFVRLEKQVELLLSSSNNLTQSIQQQVSEQNTSMLKIKSEFDKKTMILNNDLKHLDSKHSQSLENISSLSSEKENHLREEFKQQIKAVESKQENEVEQLLAQQKELDAKSQEILSQTNTQVKQHAELLKQHQASLSQNDKVLEQHQSQHELHNSEIVKHTDELNHHQLELDKQNAKLGTQNTKLDNQHIVLDKHESQLQQLDIQLKQTDTKLKQTTSELKQTSSELDKKVEDNKELHHQEIKVLANHVSKHNEAIETKLIELNQEAVSLQKETSSQSNEINDLKQNAVNLRKKTTINHEHFVEVNNDLAELDLLFQKQTQQSSVKIESLSSIQTDHADQLSTLNTSSEELFAHTDEIQTKTDNLTIQALQAKESIELLDKKQHNTLTDLIKTNSKVIKIDTKIVELEKGIGQANITEAKHFSLIQYASFIAAIIFISTVLYLTNAIQTEEQKTNDHFVQQSQTMSQQQKKQEVLQQQYKRHDSALLNAKQVQYNMNKEINQLKNELKIVKQENVSLQAQQDKVSQQLSQVKGNLQLVDDNVDYLNHSVGPLVEYQHGKLNGPNWIVLQHPENLTILISKHKSKNELFKFLEEESYFLRGNLAFYTLNEGSQTYYILTYGSFENIQAAKQSVNELPYSLGNQQQLILPFKDIQPSILVSH